MGAKVWGRVYNSGELATTAVYQPVKPNNNLILKGLRTWLVFYDNPVVDNFIMKIYSDRTDTVAHAPGVLLHTSTNTFAKSDIITLANGYKEIYFDFDNVNLNESTWYNFVINAETYTPAGDAHVAWRLAFPDPVYATNLQVTTSKLNVFPHAIYFIAGEF